MTTTYQPCRVLILATMADDSRKRISINNTGYGIQRHADRWLARGAKYVNVTCWSNSTGRQIDDGNFYDAATMQARAIARAASDARAAVLRATPNQYTNKIGARVLHGHFGAGTVVSATGIGDEGRIVVDFDSVGRKELALAYASIKLAALPPKP